jgi:hypothetical protein
MTGKGISQNLKSWTLGKNQRIGTPDGAVMRVGRWSDIANQHEELMQVAG